jgi:esterase/lipase
MALRVYGLVLILVFLSNGCASKKNIKPIASADTIGIVLLHGKNGDTRWVSPLASDLRTAGYNVVTPNMPWHRQRIYEKTFEDSLIELKSHVYLLKKQGNKVFIAGHSLGAVAAAGYASKFGGIDGIVLLAPGHFTGQDDFKRIVKYDVDKSRKLIEEGKGDSVTYFHDINIGGSSDLIERADIFYSWFAPDGPANFVRNMSSISEEIPILYVAASNDTIPETKNMSYAFNLSHKNKLNTFSVVESNHLNLPYDSYDIVSKWLSYHIK